MKWSMLLFFSVAVSAANLPCQYEGGKFRVQVGDKSYEQRVTPNVSAYALTCGEKLATFYDGVDWVVFDLKARRFEWASANKDFTLPISAVSGDLAAIYEGGNFIVYEGGRFLKQTAYARYGYAKLAVSDAAVLLYDGESIHAYVGGRLSLHRARFRTPWARVTAIADIAIVYDGQDFMSVTPEGGLERTTVDEPFATSQLSRSIEGGALCTNQNVYLYCRRMNRFVEQAVGRCDDQKLGLIGNGFSLIGKEKSWRVDPISCAIIANTHARI